jgi:hypothetical protein
MDETIRAQLADISSGDPAAQGRAFTSYYTPVDMRPITGSNPRTLTPHLLDRPGGAGRSFLQETSPCPSRSLPAASRP